MKNKIAIASAFLAASSFSTAEIVINDFLSFEGFVDMSYTHTNQDVGAASTSSNSYQIDQVEIDWLFDFDTVTAQIDLEHSQNNSSAANTTGGEVVEQAFATYHFDNGGGFTAGRFASMLGFEAFEPTGLYQYSLAYLDAEDVGTAFTFISGGPLPGYDQGVKYTYEGDSSFFGVSLVDSVTTDRLGGSGPGGYGAEVAGAFYFDNGLSWFGGARYDDGGAFDDSILVNTYMTYETGAWIFAGELNYQDVSAATDQEIMAALLMANFAYSDAASVTGRLSYVEGDQGALDEDFFKYTIAHGYAFTDNLFLVNEISYVDGENSASNDVDVLTFAAELIFSF